MPGFARPCLICGRRVESGQSRCELHLNQRYAHALSCYVCGRLGPKGYCPDHDPYANTDESKRLERQPWRNGYRDPAYRANKKKALARAHGSCEKCQRRDLALEVDHIVPLSTAQSSADFPRLNALNNLTVLCVMCHRAKTRRAS